MTNNPTQPPQPPPNAIKADPATDAFLGWQNAIHHELKSINTKLSFFVLITIIAIILSLFSSLFRL